MRDRIRVIAGPVQSEPEPLIIEVKQGTENQVLITARRDDSPKGKQNILAIRALSNGEIVVETIKLASPNPLGFMEEDGHVVVNRSE